MTDPEPLTPLLLDDSIGDELRAVLAHNRDEEIEHAMMNLEWLRRNTPVVAAAARTFLFSVGPITRTPGTDATASSSRPAMRCSCAATAGMPSSARYCAAAPSATTCDTICVPASKRCGGGA